MLRMGFRVGVVVPLTAVMLCCQIPCAVAAESPSPLGEVAAEEAEVAPWTPLTSPTDSNALKDAVVSQLWARIEAYWHLTRQGHTAENYPVGRLIGQVDGPKYGEMRGLLEAITVLDPQDYEAWTSAAWMLWHWNNDEASIVYDSAAKALKDPADLSRLYLEWATFCLVQTFDVAGAADKLEKADSMGPPSKPTKHIRAQVLVELGRYADAREVWKKCVQLWPDDKRAADSLAFTDEQLLQEGEQARKEREARAEAARRGESARPAEPGPDSGRPHRAPQSPVPGIAL